ncbi:MAG: hypothetical protein J6N52_13850 [Clostridia bacterium]|nr:hypothetical protein [Clostridia bacterium]
MAKKSRSKNKATVLSKDDKNNKGNLVTDEQGNVIEFTNEKAPRFPFLFRRFLEILLISVVSSLPFAIIYALGFSKSETWAFRFMGASLIIFTFTNIYFFRAFFYSMGNKSVYFNVNVTAYTLFAILNLAVLAIFKDNTLPSLYSFLFMPIKLANLALNKIYTTGGDRALEFQMAAAVFTHIFMYFVIFISPLEMYAFESSKKRR